MTIQSDYVQTSGSLTVSSGTVELTGGTFSLEGGSVTIDGSLEIGDAPGPWSISAPMSLTGGGTLTVLRELDITVDIT